jgi:hypothetical protein
MYRVLILLLIATASLLACKTESPKAPSTGSDNPGDESAFTVKGRAYAGVVDHGIITVHPITDEGWSFAESVASTSTDASGDFSLSVAKQYLGLPVVLRIRLDEGDLMKCVLTSGCPGQVGFGESFEVGPGGLQLFLAIPELLPGQSYSITPFSHIAFKAVEKDVGGARGNGNSLYLIQARNYISRANTRVASRFGLIADLPTLSQIDITDATEIQGKKSSVIRDSIIGNALLQGAGAVYSNLSIIEALDSLATQYVDVGLPGVVTRNKVVSQALLLQVAIDMLADIQRNKGWDLSQTVSGIQAELDLVSLEEPNQYSHGVESKTHLATSIERGVELVSDVRRVANSVDLRKIVALGSLSQIMDGGASDLLQQFGMDFGDSSMLSGDEFRDIQAALARVGEAVLAALIDYYANGSTSSSYDGVAFAHNYLNNLHIFTFTSTIYTCEDNRACPVDLNLGIGIHIDRFMGNAGTRTIAARYIGVDLTGFLHSSGLYLHFLQQDRQAEFHRPRIENTSGTEGIWKIENYDIEGESVAIRLPIEFRRQNSDAMEFSRMLLSISADEHLINFSQRKNITAEADDRATRINENLIHFGRLEGFRLGVANAVVNNSSEAFLGALNLVQPLGHSPENITLKMSSVLHCGNLVDESSCEEVGSDTVIEGETPNNYLKLTASAGFKAKLKGISEPVILELSGTRESPTANAINNLKVSYPGHAVSLNGTFNNNGGITALDAVNLDGTRLNLKTVNGKRSGILETPTKEKVADLIDMGQWIKIQYTNGDFESL